LPPGGRAPSSPAKPAATGSSFLDDWLAKRQETIVKPTSAPPKPQPAARPPEAKPPGAKKPEQPKGPPPKLEASVDNRTNDEGVFHIDRDIDPAKHQSQVVHIDKEGNLTFGD
jgi:hypothetical protein